MKKISRIIYEDIFLSKLYNKIITGSLELEKVFTGFDSVWTNYKSPMSTYLEFCSTHRNSHIFHHLILVLLHLHKTVFYTLRCHIYFLCILYVYQYFVLLQITITIQENIGIGSLWLCSKLKYVQMNKFSTELVIYYNIDYYYLTLLSEIKRKMKYKCSKFTVNMFCVFYTG